MPHATITAAHETAATLLAKHGDVFGDDLGPYSGHVHRVIEIVGLVLDVPDELARPLGVAGFFHDSAIWFDRTWDYLPKSVERAGRELGDDDHVEVVGAMIAEHHRLRAAHHEAPIVDAFRRADLCDISFGRIRPSGVSRRDYLSATSRYPAHGLRPMLLRAFGRGLRENPLRPAPMVKF